ncbi:Conserved_hypothetical protein [Hexamita inflata]|uniref:Uncharacterized protein n=1 Tax=Hexamita inflata TaxID=28002 RepID=A0AA86TVH2_9EUKA|nr:Conserved hypothetical protein [Hexamita inflata]
MYSTTSNAAYPFIATKLLRHKFVRYILKIVPPGHIRGLAELSFEPRPDLHLPKHNQQQTVLNFSSNWNYNFHFYKFSLEFPQDKIIISSVAGSLKNRIFDHLGCKMSAKATVSLVPGAESIIASTVPVQECKLAPITEIVRVVAYLKTNEISQTPINLTTFGLPLAIQPQYIKYVNALPFVCATRPDQAVCIGLSRLMMQNEFFSFMGGTRNTINVRYQGGVQVFQQNVRFLFSNVQSAQPQDCFTKTTLTFYDKYLRVEADPGLCTQCSLAYFASFLSFDSAYLRIVMSINEDYSGFTYQNEYLVTDYSFDTKFDKMLTCEMMTDVHACQTQLPLLKQSLRQNSSVFLALVFKKDGAVVYKTLFTPTITETKIQSANVTLFDSKICVYFKPLGNEYSGGPSKCFFELGRRMKFII